MCCMIEISSAPRRKSSAIFRKFLEILSGLRTTFWESLNVFGKSSKESSLVCLYNKQNDTWLLVDIEFLFSCRTSETQKLSTSWTLEEKFHIYAHPCIILYIFFFDDLFDICAAYIHCVYHGFRWIAVITVAPAVKYSFVSKGMQTRRTGQHKAKLTLSPRLHVKPLITVITAIGI